MKDDQQGFVVMQGVLFLLFKPISHAVLQCIPRDFLDKTRELNEEGVPF